MTHMIDDLRQAAPTVALPIGELLAQLCGGAGSPGHGARWQAPIGRARNPRELQISILMAPPTLHADDTAIIRAPYDGRLVQREVRALRG
jgi:hypothetical protein